MTPFTAIAAERLSVKHVFVLTLVCSLLTNVALGVALILRQPSTRTIIVPPTLAQEREVWSFTDNGPNEAYLGRWASHLLSLLTDLTPATVAHQRETLLQNVHPSYFAHLETELLNEAQRINRDRLSTYFTPLEMSVDAKALTVGFNGELAVLIGDSVTKRELKHFTLQFTQTAGRLSLSRVDSRSLSQKERQRLERQSTS